MAYDYNEYMRKYNEKNIVNVSFKLHKSNDADIIEVLENSKESKQATIKKLIRKAVGGVEMKVFRKKIFFEQYPEAVEEDAEWVKMCDGKEVKDGKIICHTPFGEEMRFLIDDSWCEEI